MEVYIQRMHVENVWKKEVEVGLKHGEEHLSPKGENNEEEI